MKKRCHIVINITLCMIIIVLRVLWIRSDRRTVIPSSESRVSEMRGFILEQNDTWTQITVETN